MKKLLNWSRGNIILDAEMQYFYYEHAEVGNRFDFSEEEAIHLVKVLRHQVGDTIHLLDGKGKLYQALIEQCAKKSCSARVIECIREEKAGPAHHIAVSPIKNSSRMEWFFEKAVELGLSQISPLICRRTEKFSFKKERYEKILLSALKQSGNLYLPVLNPACSFDDFIQNVQHSKKYLADCKEQKQFLANEKIETAALVLIGPEGDFTEEEIEAAQKCGFQSISLGNLRLRTETAALTAACLITQSVYRK